MVELNWQLHKFTIGIKHDITFTISDIHGTISDKILGARKKFQLPSHYFSQLQRTVMSPIS